jgi:competence protein ComEC
MFITNFCPSIVRAGIFFIILYINKGLKLNIKTINILLLTLFISLLSNPFLIYSVGFEFSFIISMYLILYKDIITRYKSKFMNLFWVSFIAFLASLPITLNNFFQINLLSVLLNLIFVPYVSFVVFPISLICFIFPFLDNILLFLINIMEGLSIVSSKIDMFIITIGKPSIIMIFIYYFVITYALNSIKNNKYKHLLLVLLLIIVNHYIIVLNKYPKITFINVGQGDSILVRLPYNKGNILIDTGGIQSYREEKWKTKNNTFSIGKDIIVSYLKSLGISHLDYLIITHGDYDHIGESINIVNSIKVNNVVMNANNINNNEKLLIKELKRKNVKYNLKKEGNIINIDKYSFFILNPHIKSNENEDSIVLYFSFNNNNVLLMGDAGVSTEEYLINKYKLNIDILKVGHHGSLTSSSEEFIKSIKPRYAIISVGLNNKFGHPSESVINRLKRNNVKALLTSTNGSIKLIFRTNDVTILETGT